MLSKNNLECFVANLYLFLSSILADTKLYVHGVYRLSHSTSEHTVVGLNHSSYLDCPKDSLTVFECCWWKRIGL